MFTTLFAITLAPLLIAGVTPVPRPQTKTLAVKAISLENRYQNTFVNAVFKDNILLAVNYATGYEIVPNNINWGRINSRFTKSMSIRPGETFAFHDDVLPEYEGVVDLTTNVHFSSAEGFKSDGYLVGDGVCHLASIMYWVAKTAGLDALAPTRHDFAPIPDVPKEFGVSIYANSASKSTSNELQNLYITNNKNKTVVFEFDYDGKNLTVRAREKG